MNTIIKTFLLSLIAVSCNTPDSYDLIILNGSVYDGSLHNSALLDIGVKGDEIVILGSLANQTADRIINANGLVVAPGFIDLHAHLEPIFSLSDCESHLRQGVTTSLGGPDGYGPLPFGIYLDSLAKLGVGMNVGFLAGHNSIRRKVMDLDQLDSTTPLGLEYASQQSAGNNDCQVVELPIIECAGSRSK